MVLNYVLNILLIKIEIFEIKNCKPVWTRHNGKIMKLNAVNILKSFIEYYQETFGTTRRQFSSRLLTEHSRSSYNTIGRGGGLSSDIFHQVSAARGGGMSSDIFHQVSAAEGRGVQMLPNFGQQYLHKYVSMYVISFKFSQNVQHT